MKKYLIAFVSLIVIVSACEKENKENFVSDEFNIHASLDNYTKASDTDFEDDDIIGIFVTENETELTSAGNYGGNGDNLEYTHLSGKWVKNNGPLKWKDSKATTVYGYSPRTTTITSVDNSIFTVSEDQSDKAKYSSADFLWAKHENIAYGSSASLKFAHQLSNIVINLKKDTSIGEITEVTIVNVANECSVNLATGALHGWYFSWEVNNVDMNKQESYAILKGMFDQLLTNFNSKLIRRPLLMSPFANEVYGMSAADYGAMWKKLFNECGFKTGDIFAPQDCVGTGKISDANYSTWMNTIP